MIDLFESIKKDIQPYIIGVPDFALRPMVSSATYDFCDDSGLWTEDQTLSAYDNDLPLYPKDPINTVVLGVAWVRRPNSKSEYAHTFEQGKVILEFTPNHDVDVRIKLANNRNTNTLLVPDWMVNLHHRALVHLSCYKLMSQEGKPWANVQGAAFHYSKYREYLGNAVIKATPQRIQMRPFA